MKSLKNIFHPGIKELRRLAARYCAAAASRLRLFVRRHGRPAGPAPSCATPPLLSSMKTNRSSHSVSPSVSAALPAA